MSYSGVSSGFIVLPNIIATNYTDLITNYPAESNNGRFAWVQNSQGFKWIRGSFGGTYYGKGTYYCNGVIWDDKEVPHQGTQDVVNAGEDNEVWVSPFTLSRYIGFSNLDSRIVELESITYSGAITTEVNAVTPNTTIVLPDTSSTVQKQERRYINVGVHSFTLQTFSVTQFIGNRNPETRISLVVLPEESIEIVLIGSAWRLI